MHVFKYFVYLQNAYVFFQSFFIGEKNKIQPTNLGDFYWTYHKYKKLKITYEIFLKSVINLRKFNLILITELLDSSSKLIKNELNWNIPIKQVLPHEIQSIRNIKKSIKPVDILPKEDYNFILMDNIYDLLFFYIGKRIYLERLSCLDSHIT